jgi:hypothetical protein
MLLLFLLSGIHMPINNILPIIGYYNSGDPYNIDIDTFDYYILHVLLAVPLFLLFYFSGGYIN